MPYIEINSVRCYYSQRNGTGTPILFCHGSGGGHHHWLFQLKNLPDSLEPIAVDLPGHGRSEGPPASNIETYRDWLHQFTESLKLKDFLLAGHSMGGAIAMAYAMKYPDHVLGLVLIGTGCRLKVLPELLSSLKKETMPADFIQYLYGENASDELLNRAREELTATNPVLLYSDLSACNNFNITDKLALIMQPSLVICGSKDLLTPVKYSRFLSDKLPRGEIDIITDAGHMAMIEKPDEVNNSIVLFHNKLHNSGEY
ncbi:MAG: alpha/beta hydrolase [Bacillota bacterium]|nr:alpha/beta hydrolase [Bacillota bacterium]